MSDWMEMAREPLTDSGFVWTYVEGEAPIVHADARPRLNEAKARELLNAMLAASGNRARVTYIHRAYAWTVVTLRDGTKAQRRIDNGVGVGLDWLVEDTAALRHLWDQSGIDLHLQINQSEWTLFICRQLPEDLPVAMRPSVGVRNGH